MNLEVLTAFIMTLHRYLILLTDLRISRLETLNLESFQYCNCCPERWVNTNRWHANESGQLVQVYPDYSPEETQMVACTGTFCRGCVSLVDRADEQGERGSVTIASRRLSRMIRMWDDFWCVSTLKQDNRYRGYKCNANVSEATERAIVALSDRRYLINDGDVEQQAIFEAQMIRLGDLDAEIEEWEHEQWTICVSPHVYETVSLASQPSMLGHLIRPRYRGHYGYDF